MIATNTNKQRDMKNEFINITLLLVSLALWCLIALGDILPGSLPNIIMFDAVIMIAICGISYLIKSRNFNFACFFFQFCIALLAVQISLSNTFVPSLYLIPACLVIVVILLAPALDSAGNFARLALDLCLRPQPRWRLSSFC